MPFTTAAIIAGTTASATTAGGAMAGATWLTGTAAISAATIAADVGLLSGGYSAYSSIQQGKYAEQQGKYQQELALREAEITEEASEHEEREERRGAKKLKARQPVQIAGGGVVPSTGTPLKVISETQAEIGMDIGLQKYGYGLQAGRLRSRAEMERRLGRSRKRASRYYAGTSLATGAYRAASLYA